MIIPKNTNEIFINNNSSKSNNKNIDNLFANNINNFEEINEKEGFTKLMLEKNLSSNYNQNKDSGILRKDNSINTQNDVTLYFKFTNGKELYLNVKENDIFSNVINELYCKYSWLNNIKIKCFLYNGIPISQNKSVKENGLKDNSQILIKGI